MKKRISFSPWLVYGTPLVFWGYTYLEKMNHVFEGA